MRTRIYWTIRHAGRAMREIRFMCRCWWLNQRVEFLEWRLGLDALAPQSQPVPLQALPDSLEGAR
jgi:hypothetical protein